MKQPVIERWGLKGGVYRIIYPYVPRRDSDPVGPFGVARAVLPPRFVEPYNASQVISALYDLNQRWLDAESWPLPHLEPWAEPAGHLCTSKKRQEQLLRLVGVADPRPFGSFTLRELIERHLRSLARAMRTSLRSLLMRLLDLGARADSPQALIDLKDDHEAMLCCRALRRQKGLADDSLVA